MKVVCPYCRGEYVLDKSFPCSQIRCGNCDRFFAVGDMPLTGCGTAACVVYADLGFKYDNALPAHIGNSALR